MQIMTTATVSRALITNRMINKACGGVDAGTVKPMVDFSVGSTLLVLDSLLYSLPI